MYISAKKASVYSLIELCQFYKHSQCVEFLYNILGMVFMGENPVRTRMMHDNLNKVSFIQPFEKMKKEYFLDDSRECCHKG